MTTKQKQCLLHVLGYYVDDIDGKWSTCSKTAARAFQEDFGLVPTGHIDETGEKALRHAVAWGMPRRTDK
jgi:peptidoglycan hydrolase-like protein with peptidoglycan-binding domain